MIKKIPTYKIKGDKIIIHDMYQWGSISREIICTVLYLFLGFIFYMVSHPLGILIIFATPLLWVLDATYVITPQYLEIKHGYIGKKIYYKQIVSYSSLNHRVLFLYLDSGKEIYIDLGYIAGNVRHYFFNTLNKKGILKEKYSNCTNFKMRKKSSYIGFGFFFSLVVFLNFVMWPQFPDTLTDILIMLFFMLLWNFLLISLGLSFTYTIKVHDKYIDVKNLGIPIQSISINEISDYSSEHVYHRSRRGPGYYLEELTINLKEGKLRTFFPTISVRYTNYGRILRFLKDNGIPTSKELMRLTYKEKYNNQNSNNSNNDSSNKKKKRKKKRSIL